jgi:amino acid adenylation domain-containing protein
VRVSTLKALENQDLPFEYLVRELQPLRDQSRNPLFQINFNHHRSFAQSSEFGGVTLTPIPSQSPGTIFDLHFFMVERKEGWRISCDFSTELFSRESADRMLGHYRNLLEQIADFPTKKINEYNILTPYEQEKIVNYWSGIITNYPSNKTIDELFIEIAIKYPDEIAISSGTKNFTYKQIHASAIHLANELIGIGVKPNDLVATMVKPSAEMICSFLAILMAGGCCVPLDSSNPQDRILFLLKECGAKIGISTTCCKNLFPEEWDGKKLIITLKDTFAEFPEPNKSSVTSDQSAFLLFTSGSTGEPKGVYIPHRGVTRLVRDQNYIKISHHDVFLQFAPFTFDASLLEIWGALLNGSKLVMTSIGASLEEISNSIINSKVTILWLTSGLFQIMVDHHLESLKGLRYLISGGDVLSVKHVKSAFDYLENTILINGYGPTENTTFTCFHTICREDTRRLSIPIGKPIANTKVYLLDHQLRPVPVGIHGELFTGGAGLATGYHNSLELNSQKFFDHPDFGRIYQTGDICRWDASGTIEFIGRKDHQVKVRGFRIELGEIESLLLKHPDVTQAKVALRGDSAEDKRIFAWVTIEQSSNLNDSNLLEYLSNQLPSFMRPDSLMVISSFPLNKNGKIEISKLPDRLILNSSQSNSLFYPPSNAIEKKLFEIWSDLLGFSTFSCDDNFFMIGGNSLMALRMFSRIKQELNCSLPLSSLLQNSSVSLLAKKISPVLVESKNKNLEIGNVVTLNPDLTLSPIFCVHGGDGGVLFYRDLAVAMGNSIPIHAIESLEIGFNGPVKVTTIRETALAYLKHIRKIQPEGPYRLAGYSFGGIVAFDLACILSEEGLKVDFLGLFDTYNPVAPKRNYYLYFGSRTKKIL